MGKGQQVKGLQKLPVALILMERPLREEAQLPRWLPTPQQLPRQRPGTRERRKLQRQREPPGEQKQAEQQRHLRWLQRLEDPGQHESHRQLHPRLLRLVPELWHRLQRLAAC